MWVHGDQVLGILDEHDLGRFDRIALAEAQFKAVGLVFVERVVI